MVSNTGSWSPTDAISACLKEFFRRDKLVEHRVVCNVNTLKRKSDAVDNTSKAKLDKVDEKAHSCDQIGHGDIDPCNLSSAFEENLNKIEPKQRKDRKQDMSNFCVMNPNRFLFIYGKSWK